MVRRLFISHSLGLITVPRLIALNGMKASEEITEEQSRQVAPPACTITLPFINMLIIASVRR